MQKKPVPDSGDSPYPSIARHSVSRRAFFRTLTVLAAAAATPLLSCSGNDPVDDFQPAGSMVPVDYAVVRVPEAGWAEASLRSGETVRFSVSVITDGTGPCDHDLVLVAARGVLEPYTCEGLWSENLQELHNQVRGAVEAELGFPLRDVGVEIGECA